MLGRGGVAREELIAVAEVMIQPEAALIVVVVQDLRGGVEGRADVRQRDERFGFQ